MQNIQLPLKKFTGEIADFLDIFNGSFFLLYSILASLFIHFILYLVYLCRHSSK